MDHDHSGHTMPMPTPMPDMDMPMVRCSMNMLWNSQVADTCVVFRSWHISGWVTMSLSCILVALISIFYAYLIHLVRNYDRRIAYSLYVDSRASTSSGSGRRETLIPPIPTGYSAIETGAAKNVGVYVDQELNLGYLHSLSLSLQHRIARAGLYALSVAISFWLMLVAMTYNTYLFGSIIIGAFIGHVMYEGDMDVSSVLSPSGAKGLACH
ncbi:Ctr copper transporter family-domain-containing protein [Naematelia encephala]|uniref:Copper transport protein n=1 Tax=Naematelia encephala TaxID=71784 RepID=A0A1Y2BHU6_9TREE|nr:Ctr copper transporter family-domain-containing protein [Naematelia encephala]